MTKSFGYLLINFLLLSWLITGFGLGAQPSSPTAPGAPRLQGKETDAEPKKKKRQGNSRKGVSFRLRLIKENKKRVTGVWHLPAKLEAFIRPGSAKKPKGKIFFEDIVQIKVLSWTEKEMAHKGEYKKYRFVPASWQIKVRGEDKPMRINKKLPLFHRLLLKQGKKQQYYYTIFYDYWPPKHRKPSWFLAQKTRFSYPKAHPLGNVVIRIDFLAKVK